jgi:glutathione synthase/RimK-type ligase-like ATP-grasp enzyme
MNLNFAGIYRQTEYSPNHEYNDLKILEETAARLMEKGCTVKFYNEADLCKTEIKEELVFSMVQGPAGSSALLKYSNEEKLIINSPESVINCYRTNMVRCLSEAGIPFPKSLFADTSNGVDGQLKKIGSEKIWIKRNDVHAVTKEDVMLTDSMAVDVDKIFGEFNKRGITRAVLQEHIHGDTVKFYAVRESGFFHWYYTDIKIKKQFNEAKLREYAMASAEALGLFIYGGDAIVAVDSSITIIDINDWPSFAPVREEAANHISQLLIRKAKEYVGINC